MGNKLEQLLNSLIEKGWKPFGKIGINERDAFVYMNKGHCIRLHKGVYAGNILCGEYDLRQIVSKESGLWQFVCENNLNYSEDDSIYNVWLKHYAEDDHESPYTYASPVWYLIESSLKDESELEDFLLSNIIIKDE